MIAPISLQEGRPSHTVQGLSGKSRLFKLVSGSGQIPPTGRLRHCGVRLPDGAAILSVWLGDAVIYGGASAAGIVGNASGS